MNRSIVKIVQVLMFARQCCMLRVYVCMFVCVQGSRVCGHCPPGFTGDGMFCASVTGGACAINNGGCHPAATCFQNAGQG